MPIGTIITFMGTTAPQDYLACDGATYNITDYPELAAFFEAQFGTKNNFGGNGTTTFKVPDLRGEFLRGTGTNSHSDQGSGANVGVHQNSTSVYANLLLKSGNNLKQYIYVDKNAEDGIVGYNSIDKLKIGTNVYQSSMSYNSESELTDTAVYYTMRPTNTSILYCIKAVSYS